MPFASVIDFLLLSAIWGSSFLFMRLAVVEFGPLPTAAVRVGIAAVALLPLMWWRGLAPQLRKHWKPVLFVGVVNSGIPFALLAFALLSISTGLSAILNATVPLFGALIAWLWLADRPTGSRLFGLAVGFTGIALLAWDKASLHPSGSGIAPAWAILAGLAAAVSYGIAASATKRYLTGLPALMTSAGSLLGAALGLALPALWLWPAHMPSARAWMAVVLLGLVCTALAYILFFRLIEQAGPARALAVTFVVPVFALVYGAVFLGESITGWMLLCGAVIVIGTVFSTGLLKLRGPAMPKPVRKT